MSPTIRDEQAEELPEVLAGLLPDRYATPMQAAFMARLTPLLAPNATILDIGAGRAPTLAHELRPAGCDYVGMDISDCELKAAGTRAYDRWFCHDVTNPFPEQIIDVDVAVSWQVLEHVASTRAALAAIHAALRPGGTLLTHVSGTFANFALIARLMPHQMRSRLMRRLLGSAEEEKFPIRYNGCWAAALERSLAEWSSVEIVPFYRGAAYLRPFRLAQRVYLWYESAVARHGVRNLATHYLIIAKR